MLEVCIINVIAPDPSKYSHNCLGYVPPLGLGYLAAVLIQNGINTQYLDMNLCSVTIEYIMKFLKVKKPLIVGLSAHTESANNAIRLSKMIKEILPNSKIILGGPHFTFCDKEALNYPSIDFVIRQEGEFSFNQLCQYILSDNKHFEEIDGLSFIKNNNYVRNRNRKTLNNLDALPFPVRDQYCLEEYTVTGPIISARGCPNNCVFCSAGGLSGGRQRLRSAENVCKEIQSLYDIGHREFFFLDDTFTADQKRLEQIIDYILEKNLKITWLCESRVDSVNPEIIKKMASAGCIQIQFGIESGDQYVLNSVSKNITIDQIRKALQATHENRIVTKCSFIIGHWSDTHISIQNTMKFAAEIETNFNAFCFFSICTPLPGTKLFTKIDKYQCEIVDNNFDRYSFDKGVMNTSNLTYVEIQKLYIACINHLELNRKNKSLKLFTNYDRIAPFNQEQYFDYRNLFI